MTKHALGLPQGSIRAVLALLLTGGVTYICIATNNLEVLSGLAGAAIGYYFSKSQPHIIEKTVEPLKVENAT